jgi:antitoxin (DNA-binding transcriptional repressor) of toxin-antitoxin stability system
MDRKEDGFDHKEIPVPSVNMLQAKSTLSRLVEDIEQGREREIVIARNGRPAAKLVPVEAVPAGKRIGVAKGKFKVPDSIDTHNEEVAKLFHGRRRS